MKDDLVKWCGVVEKAERFVNVLRDVQNLWLSQEVPLTSMVIQDNHPWTYRYFGAIRERLASKMAKLEGARSLVDALVDEKDYLAFCDLQMSLRETHQALSPGITKAGFIF